MLVEKLMAENAELVEKVNKYAGFLMILLMTY